MLAEKFQVPRHLLGLPIGVRETDRFFDVLRQGGPDMAVIDTLL